jgi:hypothetical protein
VTFLHWFSCKEPRHRSSFSTFWIKNLLIPYLIGGNTSKPMGKREKDSPIPRGRTPCMRVVFFTWLTLIAAGIVFFTIIGLGHH